jgi:hypothetical protein
MFDSVNPTPSEPLPTNWGPILAIGAVGLAVCCLVGWSFLYGPLGAPDPVGVTEMSSAGTRSLGKIIGAVVSLGVAGVGAVVKSAASGE